MILVNLPCLAILVVVVVVWREGVKEKKNSFSCFARQRRPQQTNALKTVPSFGKEQEVFYSLGVENKATDKDQGRCKLAFFVFVFCLGLLSF